MKLIKIPFSKGGLGRTDGVELAPDAIIKAGEDLYLNESGYDSRIEIDQVDVDQNNMQATHEKIIEKINQTADKSEKVIILGGDHSITYPAFKAFAMKNPGAGIIVFDAHPDCMSDDSRTHEDYLSALINEKILDPDQAILIAIRNWDGAEKEFMEANKLNVFNMKKIAIYGLESAADAVTETAREWPALYLSIDIDAVDPAFAPGTGYIEPAGMTSRELIYFLQRIKLLKNLKMIDLVEINPKKDQAGLTVKLGAKIVKELI